MEACQGHSSAEKPTLDVSLPENSRPISLLPYLAKIIESHVNITLTKYLENNKILDGSQNGFWPRHSTEFALLVVTEHLRAAMDEGNTSALILLDLSAAFDTVSHKILLQRLGEIGVRGKALAWFASFLSERSFQVYAPPYVSSAHPLSCGVPQGSALSHTLLNVYVRPLAQPKAQNINIDTQLIFTFSNNPDSDQLKFLFGRYNDCVVSTQYHYIASHYNDLQEGACWT